MTLSSVFSAIKRAFGCDDHDTPVMGHVPVQHERNYAKKLARARERHAKPFHTHENKPRETPPSHDLQQFNQASAKAKPEATVTKIKASARGRGAP